MKCLVPSVQDEKTEIRISYRSDPEMINPDDLYMNGPRAGICVLRALYEGGEKAPLNVLEKDGYDPQTLVFSIRKKGVDFPPPEDASEKNLSEISDRLGSIINKMKGYETAKGVAVLDEDDILDIISEALDIKSSVEALSFKDGENL